MKQCNAIQRLDNSTFFHFPPFSHQPNITKIANSANWLKKFIQSNHQTRTFMSILPTLSFDTRYHGMKPSYHKSNRWMGVLTNEYNQPKTRVTYCRWPSFFHNKPFQPSCDQDLAVGGCDLLAENILSPLSHFHLPEPTSFNLS